MRCVLDVDVLVAALLSRQGTPAAQPPSLRAEDPDDDYLVALAEHARAVIVSGDRHLLGMAGQLPVYAPADFRHLVRAGEGG